MIAIGCPPTELIATDELGDDPTIGLSESLRHRGGAWIQMDARGQFYYQGVLIPYPSLLKTIEIPAEPARNQVDPPAPSIGIEIPVGLTEKSPALHARLTEIRRHAKVHGWNIYVH